MKAIGRNRETDANNSKPLKANIATIPIDPCLTNRGFSM